MPPDSPSAIDLSDHPRVSESTWLKKARPPVCPHPCEALSALLLPWYIDDRDRPTCPSRCCKRCDFCCFHRCCGNKVVRHLLILLAALVIFWLLWCIGIAIALSNLSPQLVIKSIEIVDPCSSDLKLVTSFDISSDSWISGELVEVSSTMHFSPDSDAFAKLTFSSDEQELLYATGFLRSETVGLKSGSQSLDMMLHLQAINLQNTALLVAKIMNNTITPVYVKTTASVYTTALWFPMTLSHELVNDFTFNKPEPGPPSTPLKILAVEVDSDAALAAINKSFAVFTWSTVFLNKSTIALRSPLPNLFLDVVHENQFIATAHVNPLYVMPIFNLSLDVALDLNLTSSQTTSIQNLVNYVTNGQNFSIQIRGSGGGGRLLPQAAQFPIAPFPLNYTTVRSLSFLNAPLQQGGPTCFIQSVLDAMPLVTFPIVAKLPCPVPTKGTPPSNSTNFTQPNPIGCIPTEWQGDSIVVSEQQSSITPTLVEAQQVTRSEASPAYVQAYIEANVTFDFSLYGRFSALYFDLRSAGKPMGFIKIDAFSLVPGQANWRGNVSWTSVDEALIARSVIDFTDMDALALSLHGRLNENDLSDLLHGITANISASSATNASESSPTAAFFAISDNPVNLSIGLDLMANILPQIEISMPKIVVDVLNGNYSMLQIISSQARALRYQNDGLLYTNLLQMFCDMNMADGFGLFVSSLLNDENISFGIRGVSTPPYQKSQRPFLLDVQVNFSWSQLQPKQQTTSTATTKSNFGFGIAIAKLFRNDSFMTSQFLTNISWQLPVSVTGVFPRLDVGLNLEPPYNGSLVAQRVAGVSLSAFTLQGSLASTTLDIMINDQNLLAKMSLKPDAFNVTVRGMSTSNVVSRIVSHFGVTIAVKDKNGALGEISLGAIKKLQPTTTLYEVSLDSTPSFLRTSVYLNLSSSTIPINLTIPAVYLSLLTKNASSPSLKEMSILSLDGAAFSSSSNATSPSAKQRLGLLEVLSSHALVLGGFVNDVINFRDVVFAVKSNVSSVVDIDFQLDRFNLGEFIDLISAPKPGGWLSLPQLQCMSTALSQTEWDWSKTGNQWIVGCPPGCMGTTTLVRPGVYTASSSVCTAARLEGALSSCGGKVLATIEAGNAFSIDKFISRSLWPLKSIEPLGVSRNGSVFDASAGIVLASLGVPLTGSLPDLEFVVKRNSTQTLLRAQISGFVIPAINMDMGLTAATTVYEQQSVIDLVSNAKTQGTNLTIAGVSGSHVINAIASCISYKLQLPPSNISKLSLFPTVWPLVTVDVSSNTSTATLSVSTRFTPEFNAGFDVFVGAIDADVSIGQLQGFPDGWTLAGGFKLQEINLKDNACSNFSASWTVIVPPSKPSFLTSVMTQYFHGYDLNASFSGTIIASGTFGTRSLDVKAFLPSSVSKNAPAETDGRCLCEPVWEDQGQLFFGECAKTVGHPNGWCKIQNGTCYGTPLAPTEDACTQQVTRTYFGCECLNPWSYNNTQYTDGTCHNPDNSPQPWCLVKPGSCMGDVFVSAYLPYGGQYRPPSSPALYDCAKFYTQAMTEAACDADNTCDGYNYIPSVVPFWCLSHPTPDPLQPFGPSIYYAKTAVHANYRVRDVCSNPTLFQASQSVMLNSAHLLGSGSGNRVVLPCLLPGTFCPYDSVGLNSTAVEILLNLSLLALPFPLQVNLGTNLDIVLQGYGLSPLVSVKIKALNFSSSQSVGLGVLITPLDLPLLQTVVKDITHGKNNVDIGIAGETGAGVGVLSAMFARVGQKVTFFKLAVDQNGFILPSEQNYNFSYWLAGTTSDSATVSVVSPLKNPLNITWDLGQVDVKAWYTLQAGNKPPVVVATSSFPFKLRPGVNNMYVNASLVSEPSLNVCAGYPQAVSPPTFCAANEILSRVLSKTSTSGIPLRLEIFTTNIFNNTVIVEVSLSIMSFDSTPTRGKVLTPSNLYLIDNYEFQIASSAWSSLSSASITINLKVVLYNPFNISLTATQLSLSVYMKDWEGGAIENSAVCAFLGCQTVPPTDNMFLLNHDYVNPGGVTVNPRATQSVDVNGVQVTGLSSDLAVHLYDNYQEKTRVCVHVTNGVLKFSLKGASSPTPLTVTQFFSRRDISAVGWAACEGPQTCSNAQIIPTWDTTNWASKLTVNPGNAGSLVDGNGLLLTSSRDEYGSAFITQKVHLAGNWETSFDVYWDYGGFTALGIGEGISMIFHDRIEGATFVKDAYYGYLGPHDRSFAIVFVADHLRECEVNCEEAMKIIRNGVPVTSAPTGNDAKRTQFVWGDDYWSTITVRYNYDTKYMYIYVGAQLYLVWTVDVMTSGFADANGMGFVGFGARTATTYMGTFRVNNWKWSRYKVAQDNVRIDGGNGLNVGFAGPQESVFNLDTRDSCNFAVYSNMLANPSLFVLLTGRVGSPSSGTSVNATSVTPVPSFPGLLKVVVFVSTAGLYDVHVKCNVACTGSSFYSLIGNVEVSPSY